MKMDILDVFRLRNSINKLLELENSKKLFRVMIEKYKNGSNKFKDSLGRTWDMTPVNRTTHFIIEQIEKELEDDK